MQPLLGLANRVVGAERKLVRLEWCGGASQVPGTIGALHLPPHGNKPLRYASLEPRPDWPSEDRGRRAISKRTRILAQPAGVDDDVVVRPENVRTASVIDAPIARVRESGRTLKHAADRKRVPELLDDGLCPVRRVVVDDEDFPLKSRRQNQAGEGTQGISQQSCPIPGADSDGH